MVRIYISINGKNKGKIMNLITSLEFYISCVSIEELLLYSYLENIVPLVLKKPRYSLLVI